MHLVWWYHASGEDGMRAGEGGSGVGGEPSQDGTHAPMGGELVPIYGERRWARGDLFVSQGGRGVVPRIDAVNTRTTMDEVGLATQAKTVSEKRVHVDYLNAPGLVVAPTTRTGLPPVLVRERPSMVEMSCATIRRSISR